MTHPVIAKAIEQGYDHVDSILPYGACVVTMRAEGGVVTAPFIVPPTARGRRLVLDESLVRMMGAALGLIPASELDEARDHAEAVVEELNAQLAAYEREIEALRWAAEQYFAANPSKPSSTRGAEAHELLGGKAA